MKSDGKLTQTDEETADVLINQFQSVFVGEGLDPISNVVESVIDMVLNSSATAEPDGLKITFTVGCRSGQRETFETPRKQVNRARWISPDSHETVC